MHLDSFVGSVEGWLVERVEERDSERRQREKALVAQRGKLTDLDRLRERAHDIYRKLLDEGESTAALALREAEKIEAEVADQEQAIQLAEAVLAEHSGPPDLDQALEYYNELIEVIRGRIRESKSAVDLNRTLRQMVAGLSAQIEEGKLLVEFELTNPTNPGPASGQLPPRPVNERHGLVAWWNVAAAVEKEIDQSKPSPKP